VGERATWSERLRNLAATWPSATIFLVVIGGIYAGFFDPTEAAAVGVVGSAAAAWANGSLNRHVFEEALLGAAETTAMIFIILLGAEFLNAFLALSGFPSLMAELAAESGWNPYMILLLMLAFYLLLGCFMDSLAMIFLTVPVFWPIAASLDFGLPPADLQIWFGIITLVVVELGLITPPVGMNVLIINKAAGDVPLRDTFMGTLPFVFAELIRVLLLIMFPGIILFLPRLLS